MKNEYTNYGHGGRLSASANTALVNSAYLHDCEDGRVLMPYLATANLAHLLELVAANVVSGSSVRELAATLYRLGLKDSSEFDLNPVHGDIYNNLDHLLSLSDGVAPEYIHAGRPRRECVNVAFLLALRDRWLGFHDSMIGAIESIRECAANNIDTLMPDFTYLQHAQPTRLSHYLLTFVYPGLRDLERIESAFYRINSSPGESGSVNGSSLGLDRHRFAESLNFCGTSRHCRDSMWQPDIPYECISLLAGSMMNICRLVDELIIWNSAEFDYVELPDDLCRSSVIMPQKKNPYPLTYFRGLSNHLSGKLSAYFSHGRIVSGNPDSRTFIYGDLIKALDQSIGALGLVSLVIGKSKFNKDNLESALKKGFIESTDVADLLIHREGISYKQAHDIVGKAVRLSSADEQGINYTNLSKIFLEKLNRDLRINQIDFEKAVLPDAIVESRKSFGGASKAETLMMVEEIEELVVSAQNWNAQSSDSIDTREKLHTLVNNIS